MGIHTTPTAAEPADRTVSEIAALERNLSNWRHWQTTRTERLPMANGTDKERRQFCTADTITMEARRDSLLAAYKLFQIDALWDEYLEACQETGVEPEQGPAHPAIAYVNDRWDGLLAEFTEPMPGLSKAWRGM